MSHIDRICSHEHPSIFSYEPFPLCWSRSSSKSSSSSSSTTTSSPTSSTRHAISTLFKVLLIISTAFAAWKGLCFVTASSSPVIVVISESMEPAFYRGDVLFVWNRAEVFDVGEVAVCWFEGRPLPMVHRIVQRVPEYGVGRNERYYTTFLTAIAADRLLTYRAKSSALPTIEHPQYQYLTKGDNNDRDDTPLYPPGQPYVKRHEVIGTIKGYIPYLGWVTILMNEHPWLKTAVFGAVGTFSFLRKKQVEPRGVKT